MSELSENSDTASVFENYDMYTPTTSVVRDMFLRGFVDRDKGLRDFEAWLDNVRAETFDEGVEARRKYDYPENPYREETE